MTVALKDGVTGGLSSPARIRTRERLALAPQARTVQYPGKENGTMASKGILVACLRLNRPDRMNAIGAAPSREQSPRPRGTRGRARRLPRPTTL